MELNYDCTVVYNAFGWKHDYFPVIALGSGFKYPDISTVIMTKNPFSALSSLYRYAQSGQKNFISDNAENMASFLRSPVMVNHSGDPESPEFFYRNPVEYWISMNWNLESISRKKAFARHLRYEDLIEAPEGVTAAIAEAVAIKRKKSAFEVPEKKLRNLGNNQHDPARFTHETDFDIDQVREHRYMEDFSGEDTALVTSLVPRQLLHRLGYAELMDMLAKR